MSKPIDRVLVGGCSGSRQRKEKRDDPTRKRNIKFRVFFWFASVPKSNLRFTIFSFFFLSGPHFFFWDGESRERVPACFVVFPHHVSSLSILLRLDRSSDLALSS